MMRRFYFKPEVLRDNPYVYSVDAYKLTLKSDFRIRLFRMWKNDDIEGLAGELARNGLGPENTGESYVRDLIAGFKNSGYPLRRVTEFPVKTREVEDHPLILSGKFLRVEHRNGLRVEPGFEQELFSSYPEQSVEEGMARAGLDPVDVGYQRIQRLKNNFEKKLKAGCEVPETDRKYTEHSGDCGDGYLSHADLGMIRKHPYVRSAENTQITLKDAFYNEAYLLTSLGMERILDIFELKREWFSDRFKTVAYSRLLRWVPVEDAAGADQDMALRIMQKRSAVMEELVGDGFTRLGVCFSDMDTEGRRKLAGWIRDLPKDPWRHYTTRRILEKIGLAKSTYYELLNNPDYGMSACRRMARDDEDILLVRRVYEYRGYKKGYRQISMMMEDVTGERMSEHRVLRLMRKYGMRTNIRRPSKNRKARKELMRRNGKPNVLKRRFKLHRPNEVRLTDVTYLDYGDGKRAYGSASIDPVTGRLVCFVISKSNDLALALSTLSAMDAYPAVPGGIIHSDQGILYFTDDFQAAVKERDLVQSMSRRGNCWDNAPQESFFGHFKDECSYKEAGTIEELRTIVQDYSVYYNEERRMHSRMKMTPAEYEVFLSGMDDDSFAAYMAGEEEKYLKKKKKAADKAAMRARRQKEALAAGMEENADEACRQESKVHLF